jgi:hypothetical protein
MEYTTKRVKKKGVPEKEEEFSHTYIYNGLIFPAVIVDCYFVMLQHL